MDTTLNWLELATNSHYQTATAIRQQLEAGNVGSATEGLDSLIAAMERSEKRALTSQLIRLMSHIIKWKCQPERRSASWAITILSTRREITEIQEEMPSLNQSFIDSIWDKCFKAAMKEAVIEMGKKCRLDSLSIAEVFEQEYSLLLEKTDDQE
jgi:hypothetical protein